MACRRSIGLAMTDPIERDPADASTRLEADRRVRADRRAGERRGDVDRRSGMDRRRGPGRRLGELRREAEEGRMAGDLLEFVRAMDEYKRVNDRPFPSWSEVFEVVHYLGYRKVAGQAEHINTACAPETFGGTGADPTEDE
ncbi:MAG: hypothetical protein C4547_08945 [Phycisphaerales bacterium]|nr:MAG: hypothetical protein C4547_08945 [Phycisphaerales bacterium]